MIEIHQIPQNLLTIDETDETHISKLDNSSPCLSFLSSAGELWIYIDLYKFIRDIVDVVYKPTYGGSHQADSKQVDT